MKPLFLSLTLAALLLGACLPTGVSQSLAQATPTATPFLPHFASNDGSSAAPVPVSDISAAPQPIEDISKSVDFGEFAAPSEPSDIAVPPQLGAIQQPEGQINIMLLGSDQRPNDGGYRTDVIILLTLDKKDNKVSLTSFPRDLYVYEPGWRLQRINAAMGHGDFALLADTMAYNFGVRPSHYVFINFQGFVSIVDSLGGIDVEVAQGLTDEREGPGDYSVPAGTVQMDGATALWYVRSRGTSNDFDRTRREQEVLTAIFWKLLSLDAITKAPQLYDSYKQMVNTDMGLTDMLALLPLAAAIGGNQEIHHYAIGPDEVTPYTTAGGGAVLLPDVDLVREIMKQALNATE